jgi:hypothetical protein
MRSWLILIAVLGSACHAKFKREVGDISSVQLQILTTTGPSSDLGRAVFVPSPVADSDEEVAANVIGAVATGAFNIVQAVKENELQKRLATAVNVEATNAAMLEGVSQTLGSGPPFHVARAGESENLLQLEVVRWGLSVPAVGVQGTFTYEVRTRLYMGDGDRVYSSRMRCDVAAGDPDAASQALMLVNNAKQVKQMTDAQLQEAFDTMARYCGGVFVANLRRHAG